MNYTIGIAAACIAASVAVMTASGTKFEKLVSSVSCAAVALCVIAPAASFFLADHEELTAAVLDSSLTEQDALIDGCIAELEERTAEAVEKSFSSSHVRRISLTADRTDPENVVITSAEINIEGANAREVKEFVAELLHCADVTVASDIEYGNKTNTR